MKFEKLPALVKQSINLFLLQTYILKTAKEILV